MDMMGKIFAERYKFLELLGSGGMADVYLVEDILLNKKSAIKILKKDLIGNRENIRHFKNEAEAISQLSHPNIVEVYDVGVYEGAPYIVMEYVDGKTLKDVIREKGALSPFFAIHIMEGVLAALIHSHKKGIIHRDIKPHNIMVSREGDIKVMDFGIARITDQNKTITLTTDIVGSVHYLSPEQASGNNITDLSDVYSSGIVLYEMLTGKVPYEGDSPVAIAVNHIQGGLIPPKDLVPSIPQELENVVLKATMRDPNKRFKSALEMSICLEKVRIIMEEGDINQVDRIAQEPVMRKEGRADGDRNNLKNDSKRPKKAMKKWKKVAIISGVAFVVLAILIAFLVTLTEGEKKLVPNVMGMEEQAAKDKIVGAGFKYQIEAVASDKVEEGKVADQNPKGGNSVSLKTVIKLKVSRGKDAVAVPNVVGKGETEGTKELEKANFKVTSEGAFNETVEAGKIISQNPTGGVKAKPGSEVKIVVSKGKEIKTVTVPNVVGQTLDAGQNSLVNSGLTVGSVTNQESADFLPGQIMSQDVAPGSVVNEKTAVNIVVAKEFAAKTFTVKYTVTAGTARSIELIIKDSKGSRVETGSMTDTETIFTKNITYFGTGTVTIRDNGVEVQSINLP